MLGREDKEPKEHIFVEGKENQDRNCGWKGSGGGGERCKRIRLEAEGKKNNLKVEKKEEGQRHGSAPGAPWLPGRSHALKQGPYSWSRDHIPAALQRAALAPPGTQHNEAGDGEARVSWRNGAAGVQPTAGICSEITSPRKTSCRCPVPMLPLLLPISPSP